MVAVEQRPEVVVYRVQIVVLEEMEQQVQLQEVQSQELGAVVAELIHQVQHEQEELVVVDPEIQLMEVMEQLTLEVAAVVRGTAQVVVVAQV